MTRNPVAFLKGALLVGAGGLCLATAPARAQVVIVPPAACIATISPVYYQGNASYWCGDSWYYWGGGAWGMYRSEPGFLRSYRGSHAPVRQFYGRGGGGGGARMGGGGRAGGGGRGGGRR